MRKCCQHLHGFQPSATNHELRRSYTSLVEIAEATVQRIQRSQHLQHLRVLALDTEMAKSSWHGERKRTKRRTHHKLPWCHSVFWSYWLNSSIHRHPCRDKRCRESVPLLLSSSGTSEFCRDVRLRRSLVASSRLLIRGSFVSHLP